MEDNKSSVVCGEGGNGCVAHGVDNNGVCICCGAGRECNVRPFPLSRDLSFSVIFFFYVASGGSDGGGCN